MIAGPSPVIVYILPTQAVRDGKKFAMIAPRRDPIRGVWSSITRGEISERKREAFTGVKDLTIITPSKWLAGLVKQSFLSEYETVVISNSIDTTVFRPVPSDFKSRHAIEDKFMILGVANVWDQRKGLKYFLKLADILENDEIIVLVGLTKKQVESLPANIIGITRTNNIQELVEIYSAADVFVNPTLEDNYPTVNLEAQACGTYVVTFDSGGTRGNDN